LSETQVIQQALHKQQVRMLPSALVASIKSR
jgi:hypothetical protein